MESLGGWTGPVQGRQAEHPRSPGWLAKIKSPSTPVSFALILNENTLAGRQTLQGV